MFWLLLLRTQGYFEVILKLWLSLHTFATNVASLGAHSTKNKLPNSKTMFLPPSEAPANVAGESRPGVDKRLETARLEQIVLNLLPQETREDSQIHIKEVQVRLISSPSLEQCYNWL